MQFTSVETGVVLYQGVDAVALHDASVEDVVFDVVAVVDDERRFNDQSGAVALLVAAGVGFVGWEAVVGSELVHGIPINDDVTAGAFGV